MWINQGLLQLLDESNNNPPDHRDEVVRGDEESPMGDLDRKLHSLLEQGGSGGVSKRQSKEVNVSVIRGPSKCNVFSAGNQENQILIY